MHERGDVPTRISVFESKELQGVLLLLKGLDRETAKQIRTATRMIGQPEWRSALAQNSHTRLENRVLVESGRLAVSNQNVTMRAGHLSKRLAGGARLSDVAHSAEFGANTEAVQDVRSSRGKQYRRHTRRQFRKRRRTGYVFYPAVASIIPRLASLWVQTTVRTFLEAMEGKR